MRWLRRGRPAPEQEGTRPRRRRLASFLAAGEVIVLVLVVSHAGPVFGARPSTARLVAPATDQGPSLLRVVPRPIPPTTTVPPTTTLPPPPPPAPTTTVPVEHPTPPRTTVPAARPTPARVTPAPPPPPPAAVRGIVPPAVPPADIPPAPNFLQSCSGATYDDSSGCVGAALQAIANARSQEGLAPMTLPSNWPQLSPAQQLFVATNLERTARGLPPLTAMATALDQQAGQGAAHDEDVGPPAGFPYTQWGANWAGAVGNPLEAIYLWMYDDGVGSANVDCTASNHSGCWGHRQNVLLKLPCRDCVMGTSWIAGGYNGDPSMLELLVETSGSPAVDFTWQQESAYLG